MDSINFTSIICILAKTNDLICIFLQNLSHCKDTCGSSIFSQSVFCRSSNCQHVSKISSYRDLLHVILGWLTVHSRTCPTQFSQLFAVHGAYMNKVIPYIYAFMPSKKTKDCTTLLNEIIHITSLNKQSYLM